VSAPLDESPTSCPRCTACVRVRLLVTPSLRTTATMAMLLIGAVLLVPQLVHATTHFADGRDTAPTFRLKRAFDVPQSKWTINPPETQPFDRTLADASAPLQRWHNTSDADVLPEHQHHRSPDPLRGPPL